MGTVVHVLSFYFPLYFLICVGIVVSVALPILRAMLPKPRSQWRADFWATAKPFVVTGAYALLAGTVVLVGLASQGPLGLKAAFLAGYMADSTLQKIR